MRDEPSGLGPTAPSLLREQIGKLAAGEGLGAWWPVDSTVGGLAWLPRGAFSPPELGELSTNDGRLTAGSPISLVCSTMVLCVTSPPPWAPPTSPPRAYLVVLF